MKIDKIITDDDLIAVLRDQYNQTGHWYFPLAADSIELYRRECDFLRWQLKQYEWVSVEDRLPDLEPPLIKWGNCGYKQKSVRVLCACKQKSGKVLVKEGYCEVWVDNPTRPCWKIPGSIDAVTHWMPLPLPPTEKEN